MIDRTRCLAVAMVAVASSWLVGCEQKEPQTPQTTSSQGSYAAGFPDRLSHESKTIRAEESKSKEDMTAMGKLPDALNNPDWGVVLEAVEAADKAGRDGGYADAAKSTDQVRAFFDEEKDPLLRKAGGSAQYVVKEKGCDVDVYGAVATGLKDGIDDRIQARLRAKNDAFIVIDRNRDALGKPNAAALETGADKIAEASYYVHVDLPEQKQRIDHDIGEVSNMKSALEDLVKDEKEFQGKAKLKPEDQKASDARIKGWQSELQAMDGIEADAKTNSQDLQQRIEQLSKDYDTAFGALKDSIKAKKK